jgi:hypothetical protein
VRSSRIDWGPIIADLARHLGCAVTLEQAHRILSEAETNIALLKCPLEFWERLERQYASVMLLRDQGGVKGGMEPGLAGSVRSLIAGRRSKPEGDL